jgi:hypothetical protein
MALLDLSAELLLHISSFLRQQDLLNVSLTIRHLHSVTEPELFREYSNTSHHSRSFLPFLRRIIYRPDLCRHIRKLSLRHWITFQAFSTKGCELYSNVHNDSQQRFQFDNLSCNDLTQADYLLLIQAARAAKVITEMVSYEQCSCNIMATERWKPIKTGSMGYVSTRAFAPQLRRSGPSYDRTFCQMLRAGVEDPLVVLLIALLPNVREIFLYGVPGDINALVWRPQHGFTALRRVTACATDGELQWPLAFFLPLLERGKLVNLKVSHASSWCLECDERREPLVVKTLPLTLQPGSLNLKRIELENCCLQTSDLRTFLTACTSVRHFLYTSGNREVGPWSPSPGRIIKLLEPFRDTLEGLILDLNVNHYEGRDENQFDLIPSLAHMTALKVLVTTPEMWHSVQVPDGSLVDYDTRSEERRLAFRVPPNVETLVFGLSEAERVISPSQLSDLITMRTLRLPSLATLCVGGLEQEYLAELEQLLLNLKSSLRNVFPTLQVRVGPEYVRSVFDRMPYSQNTPDTKWVNGKYVTVPSKFSMFLRAYERIRNEQHYSGRDEDYL